MWKPEDQTPYVLTQRAVRKGWIPPYSISCLPPSTRSRIPDKFKYWEKEITIERKQSRDELVKAIKSHSIKLSTIYWQGMAELPEISESIKAKGVLQHRWFESTSKPIRTGPSTEYFELRIEWKKDKPLMQFILSKNLLESKSMNAVFKWCLTKDWMTKGTKGPELIKPGTPGNPTKATPAYIETLDTFSVDISEVTDVYMKMVFEGKKLKGTYIARKPEESMNLWRIEKEEN